MDKETTGKLITKTFQDSFNKESFVHFIKNLLNHIQPAHFIYRGNSIPDAYKPYIKTLERIGKYQDKEDKKIDLLIVQLKKETSLERARTMQKNFIAWYLNGSRGDILKDAALVAFVAPNSDDWRFSLVKMDYRFDASGEKVKVKQELTPARRFSFLVGKNESSHTAQSSLTPILQDDENNPTLKDLEDAFSIEKVTKEFFEKYHGLFVKVKEALDEVVKKEQKIKQDFKKKNIDTGNFAKKLLGQIVFLYFLQKKGWFGVKRDKDWGTGPKDFLRGLFNKEYENYQNFFNDILEPLFYEALANERSDDFYSRFNCKIPFLNGGLFDPINHYDWIHTDILLPNNLFSNKTETKEGDVGAGILDIFDRYNFTVKEDEPLEKEVAVDPEMLGKVFENLLEVKDRKSKGAYYTPREIVHYMCQQSLINYLHTEVNQELKRHKAQPNQANLLGKPDAQQLKIDLKRKKAISKHDLETLIQFGETAVEHDSRILKKGKETKTYSFKLPQSIRNNAKLIDEKLEIIRVCDPAVGSGAFPVGMMNEIVRARNALTPYLSLRGALQACRATKQSRSIYDFKRHAIQNCLYGVDIDPGAVEIAKLRLWLSLVVDEADIKQIKPLPNLDYKIVCGNSLLGVEKNLFNANLFNKLEKLKPLFFNETSAKKKQEYKKQIDELINQITNGRKDFDFEIYFSEVFSSEAKSASGGQEKKGFDVVIANPPYVNFSNLSKVDRDNYKKTFTVIKNKVDLYAFFIERGNQILKTKGILTYIIPHTWKATTSFSKLRDLIFNNLELKIIVDLDYGAFEATVKPVVVILQKHLIKKYFILVLNTDFDVVNKINIDEVLQEKDFALDTSSTSIQKTLFQKIEKESIPLSGICKFTRGIKTSNDKRFIKRKPADKEYHRVIRGRDIRKYSYHWDKEYIWYRPDLMREKVGCLPHSRELFEVSGKILLQRISKGLVGCFDEQQIFALDTCLVSDIRTLNKKYSLKFILALLNSSLLNFWYHKKFALPTVSGYELHQLPIKSLSSDKQQPYIELVDKIITLTKDEDYLTNSNKQAKVADYEKQIDQLVYKLYGLTKEEIKIVESQH